MSEAEKIFDKIEYDKKSGNDGIKDSYFHMSPIKGDSSQGAFFEIPEISF